MPMNEAERMYEGVYTTEEIELNRRLLAECIGEAPDTGAIEALLEQGADPLGALGASGEALMAHVYGEIISETLESGNVHLPRITALFLAHGMDVDHPRIPYEHSESQNPMWVLAFGVGESALCTLKMLLDRGLSADSAAQMWEHALTDLELMRADPIHDEFWRDAWTWTLRAMMLCASCERIGGHDECLRKAIACEENSFDLGRFRSWEEFDYRFCALPDASCVARIIERESQREVWHLRIGASA